MLGDALMHSSDIVDPVQSPRDAGLVRNHCDGDAGPVEARDRLGRPFDELDAIHRTDISVINDDRPVPIEKDSRAQI
jgi:hypothetical protein